MVRLTDAQLRLLDAEAQARGTNRSVVLREIVQASLDPKNRKGQSYGRYLRAREVQIIRQALSVAVICWGIAANALMGILQVAT